MGENDVRVLILGVNDDIAVGEALLYGDNQSFILVGFVKF
jgi:hypothetical protein